MKHRGMSGKLAKAPTVGKLHEGSYNDMFVPDWDKVHGMGQQLDRVKTRYANERRVPRGGKGMTKGR